MEIKKLNLAGDTILWQHSSNRQLAALIENMDIAYVNLVQEFIELYEKMLGVHGAGPEFSTIWSRLLGFPVRGFTDQQAYLLLKLQYFKQTTTPTIFNINEMMVQLERDLGQKVLAFDALGDMQIIYYFDKAIAPWIRDLIYDYDLLPRPAGVGVVIKELIKEGWGFGRYRRNFCKDSSFGTITMEALP